MRTSIYISGIGIDLPPAFAYLGDVKGGLGILSLVHAAICSGPVLLLIVAYFAGPRDQLSPLVEIGWGYGCVAAIAGFFLPSLLGRGKSPSDPSARESATDPIAPRILQWAAVESGALLNGVSYFLTGNQTSAGVSIALILLLAYFRPTDQINSST